MWAIKILLVLFCLNLWACWSEDITNQSGQYPDNYITQDTLKAIGESWPGPIFGSSDQATKNQSQNQSSGSEL